MNLKVDKLSKKYDKNLILDDISFDFIPGKIYGLLGVNGSGKTTFFDLINGDIKPTSGSFYLSNEDDEKLLDLISDDIGYVKSTPMVPDFLTAREFVDFYIDVNKDSIIDLKDADEYLEEFYIDLEDRDKLLKDFSHGMKNKVLMLINFINNPKVLLLDEPLTSFDPLISDYMKKKLLAIRKDKVVIISTHIMEIAINLCDEIILLKDGNFEIIDNLKLGKVKSEKAILKYLKDDRDDK